MRKIAFLLSLALFVFLQFSYAQTPVSKPEQIIREDQEEEAFKEEAKWHFTSALEQLKKETVTDNERKEAARILNEIIDCYDPDDLEAYKLLIKIYRELQDENSKTIIEERCRAREKYLSELASEESKEVYSKDSALNTALVSLGAQDPKQRALAKKSLLAALKTNGLTAGLSAALSSRNIKRAKLAADILGEIKNPQASAALGGLLDSSSPALKIRVLEALSKTGAEAGLPYFIKALSDDYYSHYEAKFRIREYASATLFGVFKEKALPLLYEAVKNEKLRWYALETLIRYSPVSAETGALLKKSLEDNNEKVVLAAIKGIEKIREQEQFLPLLNSLALRGTPNVRAAALKIAGQHEEYLDTVLKALSDSDKYVVKEAVKCLGVFNLEPVREALIKIAGDEKADVAARWHAIKALGENYRKNSASELKNLLENNNFWIRSAAAAALGIKTEEKEGSVAGLNSASAVKLDELALKLLEDSGKVYEENRQAAIRRALRYLLSEQAPDGHIKSKYFPLGATQLAVICLLSNGYDEGDSSIKKALNYILEHRNKDGSYFSEYETEKEKTSYLTAYAIRALAATKNEKYSGSIRESLEFLSSIQDKEGGFGYFKGNRNDLSATETVLSGLAAGYNFLGKRKIDETWLRVSEYIKAQQNTDGGFGYSAESARSSYGSMTTSGLVCQLLVGKDKDSGEVKGALNWIGGNYTLAENPKAPSDKHFPFYLKSLAEALHSAGISSIKDEKGLEHYWFRELAEKLIKSQRPDGGWDEKWYEPVLAAEFYILILQTEELKESGLGIN